jgi:hypothetical protein
LSLSEFHCPPRHTISSTEYVELLESYGSKYIIGGDWNAKHFQWGARLITPNGRNLLEALNKQNCNYLSTGEPMYWPSDYNKFPDLLDFFIYKVIATNCIQIESNHELSSDHTPVITALRTHVINNPTIPTLFTNATNWNSFRTYIEDHINTNVKIKETDEVNQTTQYFTILIQEAARYSIPTPPNKIKNTCNIPLHISELVAEKRRARNRWQRS